MPSAISPPQRTSRGITPEKSFQSETGHLLLPTADAAPKNITLEMGPPPRSSDQAHTKALKVNHEHKRRKKKTKPHRKHHKRLEEGYQNDAASDDDYESLFSSSPIVFLDPIDPTTDDDEEELFYGDDEEPVTEVSDQELRRLGFPVGEEEEEEKEEDSSSASAGGGSFLPGLESPFIHFTSRKCTCALIRGQN